METWQRHRHRIGINSDYKGHEKTLQTTYSTNNILVLLMFKESDKVYLESNINHSVTLVESEDIKMIIHFK